MKTSLVSSNELRGMIAPIYAGSAVRLQIANWNPVNRQAVPAPKPWHPEIINDIRIIDDPTFMIPRDRIMSVAEMGIDAVDLQYLLDELNMIEFGAVTIYLNESGKLTYDVETRTQAHVSRRQRELAIA